LDSEESEITDVSEEEVKVEKPKRRVPREKALMPPPSTKPTRPSSANRRFSMRAPTAVETYGSPRVTYEDRETLADSINSLDLYRATSRSTTNPSSRGSSNRRPSLTSKATSYSNSTDSARIMVEGGRRRQMSYYGLEQRAELLDKERELEALRYQEARTAQAHEFQDMYHRETDFDSASRLQQLRDERARLDAQLRRQAREPENSLTQPLTEKNLKRRSIPSEPSSHRSRTSASSRADASTRVSGERTQRAAVTAGPASERGDTVSGANLDGVKLRVDITSGFEIEHENHLITLVPGDGDGKAQLIIGSRTGRETSYAGSVAAPSVKGSVVGSRVVRQNVGEERKRKAMERDWQRLREEDELKEREMLEREEHAREERDREEQIKAHERKLEDLRRRQDASRRAREEDERSRRSGSSLKSLRSVGKRRVGEAEHFYGA